MHNPVHSATASALTLMRDQFGAAGQQYGRLHHALLQGGSQCHFLNRVPLQRTIAGEFAYESPSFWREACSFFFGEDLQAAVEAFNRMAGRVYDLLDDGSGQNEFGVPGRPLYGLPELPIGILSYEPGRSPGTYTLPGMQDYGKGGALLYWCYWLGERYGNSIIAARHGLLTATRAGEIILPDGTVFYERNVDPHDFETLWMFINSGQRNEVYIYRRSVFTCAQIGIGVLLEHLDRMAGAGETGPAAADDASGKPDAVAVAPSHSADFTTVNWNGTQYTFDDGLQAKAVGCLWAEYEKGGLGLSEKTIGQVTGSNAENYRLASTFRNHEAWETMIVKVQQGIYRLKKPE